MWETSKITNAGLSLFASWLQGTNLIITKAAGGSGTSADIAALTALTNQKQVASITSYSRDGNKFSVKLRFPNASQAYTLNQIGIFAQLDNGAETLIAVYQDEDGVNIPASGEFYYGFAAVIAYSNAGTLTVTVDGSEYVTAEELESALANKQSTISASGILKGTGNGIVSATAGTDYQAPTQILTVEENMADADSMPFYKSVASSHRRITWAKIKALFTALFDTKYAAKSVETSKQDKIQLTGIIKGTGTSISTAQSGTDYQAPTQSLPEKTTIVDSDVFPMRDTAHKKVSWANIKAVLKTYFDTLYDGEGTAATKQDKITATGILKGNGDSVTSATAGTDYQVPTQNLTAEGAIADNDVIPFYDTSVSNSRKTTWANIKTVLETFFTAKFAAKSVETTKQNKISLTGLLKGDGNTVSAAQGGVDYQNATQNLTEKTSPEVTDAIPLYDGAHKKVAISGIRTLFKTFYDTLYAAKTVETSKQDKIQLTGILKGNGTSVTSATAGSDYQVPTRNLTAENNISDSDNLPFYDQSVSNSRKIPFGELRNKMRPSCYYGTSESASATVAKVASVDDFFLKKGCLIIIKLAHKNTAESPTLNVGSSGAVPIVSPGKSSLDASDYWSDGDYVGFQYDGESWVQIIRFGGGLGVEVGNANEDGSQDGETTITFEHQPKFVFVQPNQVQGSGSMYYGGFLAIYGVGTALPFCAGGSGMLYVSLHWENNSLRYSRNFTVKNYGTLDSRYLAIY